MKKASDLHIPFSDAENFRRKENREDFNNIFIRNTYLSDILDPSKTFLIGDKGTGKTAYAVFLSNNTYMEHNATLKYIRETEYIKFIQLKKEKNLNLSDYQSIWKILILLLFAEQIFDHLSKSKSMLDIITPDLRKLKSAIDEFYNHAFTPEIQHAISFIQSSSDSANLILKYLDLKTNKSDEIQFNETKYQTNLLYIQKRFESVLSKLKLKYSNILFIDGIDIRPSAIKYVDYIECIKGLANASWELNNDYFSQIKGSKGRMRIVLLLRPDIYASLGLQNQNTKIRDNSVVLKWNITYKDYRKSDLFNIADTALRNNQENVNLLQIGKCWDYYFDFNATNLKVKLQEPSSFISFLRFSLYRPRDILVMLKLLVIRKKNGGDENIFCVDDFNNPQFRGEYAEYLLGEIKDQLLFYYSEQEYEIFLKFFEYLKGSAVFTYEEYTDAFKTHIKQVKKSNTLLPQFMQSEDTFLQFLFDLNVICYKEMTEDNDSFIHWAFTERNYSNISPKVKFGQRYEIFYGLTKALNMGKRFVVR